MKDYKFEVIRDEDGQVSGYKLGKYYLMKHYYWANNFEWIINTTGQSYYYGAEMSKAIASGEVELAHTCKAGKARLVELVEKEA